MNKGVLLFVFLSAFSWMSPSAFAQEPIRIDRPKEGDTVSLEIEVAGVASPGATVEVWVDRVFIADTVAEPDGWYVARIRRPPSADEKSRIFVHELNAEGQRTSSAVVRVVWSQQPADDQAVPPPPDGVASDPPPADTNGDRPIVQDAAVAPPPDRPPRTSRGSRIALEYMIGIAGGITGAVVGLVLSSPIGEPDSSARAGANLLLGSVGGGLGSAAAVYGVGYALEGNGSFMWTAVGGMGGAFLIVIVGLAADAGQGGSGLLLAPVALGAFALPVLGYELTSDVSRRATPAATVAPSVSFTRAGTPTVGIRLGW